MEDVKVESVSELWLKRQVLLCQLKRLDYIKSNYVYAKTIKQYERVQSTPGVGAGGGA